MDEIKASKILAIAKKRANNLRLQKVDFEVFDIDQVLKNRTHTKQYNFLVDNSRYKVACTSRQAGKTKGIALQLCLEPIFYQRKDKEASVFAYVSLTKLSAKSIIWNDLLQIIEDQKLEKYIEKIDNTLS